jgi:hypothetical protein
LRVLTIVNLSLWCVLFMAWLPYTVEMGLADPVSTEVRAILAVTAILLMILGVLRLRRRRLTSG